MLGYQHKYILKDLRFLQNSFAYFIITRDQATFQLALAINGKCRMDLENILCFAVYEVKA